MNNCITSVLGFDNPMLTESAIQRWDNEGGHTRSTFQDAGKKELITKPGIDKGYGIRKLRDTLGIAISDMIFIGDAIFPGGNDYPAEQAGAFSICVRDPEETKHVVEAIIACLSDSQALTAERTS